MSKRLLYRLLDLLPESWLGFIMGSTYHLMEKLNPKEKEAERSFMKGLRIHERKTKKPVIVAIIGLVGSGKSSVAKALAELIGATVIEGGAIRLALSQQGGSYEKARAIAENATLVAFNQRGNVILDSDFVDKKKRASLREKARVFGVRLIFICTYADYDVMVERIRSHEAGIFFDEASTSSQAKDHGKDVKLRELWRRTPHHYRWVNQNGGEWVIKNPPCKVLADIDTTDPKSWPGEVEKLARKLMS